MIWAVYSLTLPVEWPGSDRSKRDFPDSLFPERREFRPGRCSTVKEKQREREEIRTRENREGAVSRYSHHTPQRMTAYEP